MSMEINELELRRIDLNLLVVFAAVMRTRSVRQASRKLALTPSAVSMALGRLRDTFGDPLFVRGKTSMEPTARALALDESLSPALRALHGAVLHAPPFDPARAERTIRFASADEIEIAVLPRLLALMREQAPGISLIVRPSNFRIVPGMLDTGDADVALTATPSPVERRHRRDVLYVESFLALYDPRQVGERRLTLARYLAVPHLIVSASGVLRGPIDDRLAELGKSRKLAAAVAQFSTLPFLLRSAPMLANVPSVAARHHARAFGLTARPLPFESPRFDVALLCHARQEADPALRWFRDLVVAVVKEVRSSGGARST
jgi:LysR family transcriptional regulator, mexEF-oprN operon transcriptional activator